MSTGKIGCPSFVDIDDPNYGSPHPVPLKIATAKTLKGFGTIVQDFEKEDVPITAWPSTGWRKVDARTGKAGGITSGKFNTAWKGDYITGQNHAVGGDYIIGKLPNDVSGSNRTHVLIRDANYHPDGGQVFYPVKPKAYILVLALPGDDVKLKDFVAFYFDGSFGVSIYADIWHQAIFPVDDEADFLTKQGKVHACVIVDTVDEFGKFLKIPLKPELAV